MNISRLALLGLLVNAVVWGLSWIGFQSLNAQGLNPLWVTAIISGAACIGLWLYRPQATREVLRDPALRWVALMAGLTNVCFNSAITTGDIVRVTLLFYLMPIWAALLAHALLGERINRWQALRLCIGLSGACLVIWQPKLGLPVPSSLADWLGIAGGMFFAANNIGLRKASHASDWARAQAMFLGGMVCSTVLALAFPWFATGAVVLPTLIPSIAMLNTVLEVALWVGLFLAANYGVQYGAARLPANVTALIMLSEVFIAGVSSAYFGKTNLRMADYVGGALILGSPFLFAKLAEQQRNSKT
jgi:drug/metabolite transporter (DMT)-like permease